MLKKAKVINEETNVVSIALGDNPPKDYVEMDVEQAYNGNWYVAGYAPEPPVPTHEEVSKMREEYRISHIDSKTSERSRKTANGTWTQEDERAYLDLDAEVTAYINEHFPYPEES